MKAQLLLPAAGMGARLGYDRPKALVDVAGKPLLIWTLECFVPLGLAAGAVIVITPGHQRDFSEALRHAFPEYTFTLVDGGTERQISVSNGLDRLAPGVEIVVIHDAARPFVSPAAIQAAIDAAAECGAATVAIPCTDTILEADQERFLAATPDRKTMWACQTPQTFRVEVIREAHAAARRDGVALTDDASLVQRTGGKVKLVLGTPLNFKVTTPTDLALADGVIRKGLA